MRLRLGCEFKYLLPNPTPMIAMLSVHYSRFGALNEVDRVTTAPFVPVTGYRDGFGNWCSRLTAPAGEFSFWTDTVLEDDGAPDPYQPDTPQHEVEDLPSETLVFLLGSRYCETDLLSNEAWRLFGNTPPGWSRVQAICDFVHNHVRFGYHTSRPTRTAAETYAERTGVCRDFTHLAVAFCRCMNIPTRYCSGYISDVGELGPTSVMDFAAWMEVYLGGRWWVFDPRNNRRRIGRVLVSQGRDAADVPLVQTFGANSLIGFRVWADDVTELAGALPGL